MTAATDLYSELDAETRRLVDSIGPNLDLLSDLLHADVQLLVRSGGNLVVAAHGQPEPVPSIYRESLVGQPVRREELMLSSRLRHPRGLRLQVHGTVVGGVPVAREVFPVRDRRHKLRALLVTETAVIEHDRLRKRSPIFRRAIEQIREYVVEGRLSGGVALGRLGPHDGVMIIDSLGEIVYVTAVAEGLYRLLGITDSLVDTQISELDTNEYVAFRAMETATCMEQRVTEQDRIWIKKAIPLLAPKRRERWFDKVPLVHGRQLVGALIIIQDTTDLVRREQEMRVKTAMAKEIHHRVKNNLQTIAALLRFQIRRSKSGEVSEALRQAISRILSVAVIHEFLSREESHVINIHEVGNRILQEVTHGTMDPSKRISLRLEGTRQFMLPAQQATSCALIINELVQNAVEHGYTDRDQGEITIRLLQTDDSMSVEIQDDGVGLPTDFNPQTGGLGLQIIRTLVREDLKGQFQMENGHGVKATVSFPRFQVMAAPFTEAAPEFQHGGSS